MPASLLDPTSQAHSQVKFTYALPSPPVIDATGGGNYTIQANQVDNFFMGLVDPLLVNRLTLRSILISGFNRMGQFVTGSLYGPTIIAASGVPIHVTWVNNLPGKTTCCRSTRASYQLISRREPSRSSRISMAVIPKQRAMAIPTPGSPRTTPRQGRPTKLRLTPMTTASKRPR